MFQILLKTQLRHQLSKINPMKNRTKNDPKPASNNWDNRPSSSEGGFLFQLNNQTTRELNYNSNMQTPAFLNKGKNRDLQFEDFGQQSGRLGQVTNEEMSGSLPHSQVLSVNEMNGDYFNPMILSNINANCKSNINRLQIMRLRNEVQELRQIQTELMEYLEDQKSLIQYITEKISLEVEEFVIEFMSIVKRKSRSNITDNTTNEYQDKLRQLKTYLNQKQSQLEQQVLQNQGLQEQLFDLEQRIVGVDLEVDRKIKERLKAMPQIGSKKELVHQAQIIKEHEQQIKQLQHKITLLQQKCHQYQEMSLYQSQLTERAKSIRQAELKFEDRQAHFRENMAKIQLEKQLIQSKNNEILRAEQNLENKITDLRNKQSELSKWQSQLTKKSAEMRNINSVVHQFTEQLNRPSEEQKGAVTARTFGINKNINEQPKRQRQPITDQDNTNHPSRVKTRLQYTQDEEPAIRHNKRSEIFEREKYDHIEKEQWQSMAVDRKNLDRQVRRENIRRPDHKSGIEAALLPNNGLEGSHTSNAKYLPANHYRDSRQASPYAHLNDLSKSRQHLSHHFNFTKNPVSQFRETSKDNRRSTEKDRAGRNLQSSRLSKHSGKDVGELSSLGSKLQRLREQLKKEIEAMK